MFNSDGRLLFKLTRFHLKLSFISRAVVLWNISVLIWYYRHCTASVYLWRLYDSSLQYLRLQVSKRTDAILWYINFSHVLFMGRTNRSAPHVASCNNYLTTMYRLWSVRNVKWLDGSNEKFDWFVSISISCLTFLGSDLGPETGYTEIFLQKVVP
jgi:hypothetical protein